VSSQQSKVLC